MKKLIFTLSCLLLKTLLVAQNNYSEAIRQGDTALKKGQYKTAINKYFAAEAFDPSKKETVKRKVNDVFDKIEALREEAEAARQLAQLQQKKTKAALAETQKAKLQADSALRQANKLINAFYFYRDRFALAHGSIRLQAVNRFYFIDKNGDRVNKLGIWDNAEQFDERGYAKTVIKAAQDSFVNYLLDTLGNDYPVAYTVQDIDPQTTKALDFGVKDLMEIPDPVFQIDSLKVLLLNNNKIAVLPSAIGKLTQLTVLNLMYNELTSLPREIGQLTELSELYLENMAGKFRRQIIKRNQLTALPAEIGQLKKLARLELAGNQLTTLPIEIGQLQNLKRLGLRRNQLTTLPDEIKKLKNLKELDLRENLISPVEQEKIRQLLPACFIRF